MTNAQLYVALVDKSIAYNKEQGHEIDTAPDNPYSVAAREILREALNAGTLAGLFNAIDAVREEAKK